MKQTIKLSLEVEVENPTKLQEAELFPCATAYLSLQGTPEADMPMCDEEGARELATLVLQEHLKQHPFDGIFKVLSVKQA